MSGAALAPIVKMPVAAAVAETCAAVAAAETPAQAIAAKLQAEALVALLDAAVRAGAKHLAGLNREALWLTLEATVALGESAWQALPPRGSTPLAKVAVEIGVPRTTLQKIVKLAIARRADRALFDALANESISGGMTIPWHLLRAIGREPRAPREDTKSDQIAVRLEPRDREAIDGLRGDASRSDWAGRLIVDAVRGEPLLRARRLTERALEEAARVDTALARRVAKLLRDVAELELGGIDAT